ncbi:predicted protein [Histoplasma mississippiense (nom. inval.)]|uniref:predicted protein n=1 Tax=Ajellomyces capsulatus (strain NAm1 / WU24) TaxID=2059318 RepID=UPI000157B50E|nr:predicted protein [Histoplasma mississippiense (nom. inval.)]EDN03061.1 predicted protein [Histoplasma mississippiense (nom. inval.)]
MARRCSYCGRFGNPESINEETGLCHKCHKDIQPSSKSGVASLAGKSGEGPSKVAAAVMLQMAAVDVSDDSNSAGSITSIHSDQDHDDEDNSCVDRNGDGNESENTKPNSQKLRSRGSSNVSSNREIESELCARCWKNPSTTILYNTPICGECYQIAQEKREHTKGTKEKRSGASPNQQVAKRGLRRFSNNQKRFQPPTPDLQPGKRLTRVCDSCRRKRKRCQHRRVVDENDPDADFRKRSRKVQTSTVTNGREGRSRTSSSSVIEVNDTVIVSETEQDAIAAPCTGDTTTIGTGTVVDSSLTASAVDSKGCSTSNLQRAVEESVHVVFSREMDRLVGAAEEKLSDAAVALDDIKEHMTAWLERVNEGI